MIQTRTPAEAVKTVQHFWRERFHSGGCAEAAIHQTAEEFGLAAWKVRQLVQEEAS